MSDSRTLTHSARDDVRTGAKLSIANLFAYGLDTVRGFVIPALLGPAVYGAWKVVGLVLQYTGYSHLGFLNALTREVPFALGRSDQERLHAVRDTAYGAGVLVAGLATCVPLVMWLTGQSLHGVTATLPMAALLGVTLASERYGAIQRVWVQASGRFGIAGRVRIVESFVLTALSLALVIPFRIPGLLFALLASTLTGNLLLWRLDSKPGLRLRIERAMLSELLRIGFPIFLNTVVNGLYWTVDSLMIALVLPPEQLGIYGLALAVFPLVQLVPEQFATVAGQRMARQMGDSGAKRSGDILPFFEESQSLVILLTACAGAGAGSLFVPLVQNYFPDYGPSIALCHTLLFGFLFYRLRSMTGFYLTLRNKQMLFLAIQVGSVLLNGLADFLVLRAGLGLQSVAWVCSLSYIVFGIVILQAALRDVTGSWMPGWIILARWTPLFVAIYGGHRWMAARPWPGVAGMGMGCGLALLGALFALAWGWFFVPGARTMLQSLRNRQA